MKRFWFLVLIPLVFSCNNRSSAPDEKQDTIVPLQGWEADLNDSTGKLEVKRTDALGPDSLNIAAVISYLNTNNPHVQLQFVKASGDTIYLSIPDAEYLTQQMGSTGPQIYFADAVYNLTEIPGYHFVNFDFEEGDHASPDVLNRDSFKDE